MTPSERARADAHPCDACGGSGKARVVRRGFIVGKEACPVCQGCGRISDRVPAKDAMADAETLREIAYSLTVNGAIPLAYAAGYGEAALGAIRDEAPDNPCPCGCGKPAKRWHFAELAAHHAFRAVPGLRGDR